MFHPNDTKGRQMIDDIAQYANQNPDSNYDEYMKLNSDILIDSWSGFWNQGYDYSLIQSSEYVDRESFDIWYGAYKVYAK